MKTVAVILAARAEKGLGLPVALAEHEGGRTFLQSLASAFAKAGCTVLGVVGEGAERVVEQHPSLELVEATAWADRPGSSLQAGLAAARHAGAEQVLVHPVDMPAVRATTLKTMVGKLEDAEAVRPTFEGAPGFPVVLSIAAVEKLLAADSGQSPEQLLAGIAPRALPVKDPGVVVRIREAALYERLFGTPPKEAPPPRRRMRKGETGEAPLEETLPEADLGS